MRRTFFLLALLLLPTLAQAATYYVDSGCGNITIYNASTRACTGGSATSKTTIQAAVNVATTAGDIVDIRAGTYAESVQFWTKAGSSGSPITYRGHAGETVTIRPSSASAGIDVAFTSAWLVFSHLKVDGSNLGGDPGASNITVNSSTDIVFDDVESFDNGRLTTGAASTPSQTYGPGTGAFVNGTRVTFSNCFMHHNGAYANAYSFTGAQAPYGFYWPGSTGTIDSCRVEDNGAFGIQAYPSPSGMTIKNSLWARNGNNFFASDGSSGRTSTGILSYGANAKIYNNVIYDAPLQMGISVSGASSSVLNNTIYGTNQGGIEWFNGISPAIKNNILVNNPTQGHLVDSGGTPTYASNLCFGTGANTSCTTTGSDPLFTNATSGDFRLLTGSPAINQGADVSSTISCIVSSTCTDLAGVVRPQGAAWDIGAYEFASSIPVITITGPTSSSTLTTASSTISVSGTSDLTSGTVTWSCDRCTPATGSTLTGTINNWTLSPALTLKAGINILTVTATATAGGSGIDIITITYAPTFPGNSLVMALPFENGSGSTATDTSGNSNNGTLIGSPTWTGASGGRYGNALQFNGTDQYVRVSDANSLDLTQGFSITAWVRPTTVYTNFRSIVTKNVGQTYRLYASGSGYCGDSGIMGFSTVNGSSGPEDNVCSVTPLQVDVWTHLAFTWDGATMTLYKNGVSIATQAHVGYMEPSTGTLQVAASEFGEYFQGLIDEVRLYNYAIPLTGGANTVFGNNCTRADETTTPSVIGDANCPITAPTPPISVKISAAAAGLKLGGTTTTKFGSVSGAQ